LQPVAAIDCGRRADCSFGGQQRHQILTKQPETLSFPADVVQKLKTYVYRLIDPRNGETFYVGKGHGNRVFSHIQAEQNLKGDDLNNKVKRIREIRLAAFDVAHVIHRHADCGRIGSSAVGGHECAI
jgi:hypothetical protein